MTEPEEKILAVGESHDTPQAITITIMDPTALESSTVDSSIVTTVQTESIGGPESSSVLVVSGDGQGAKNILQTVTETHMGAEELPIISNISNPDHEMPEKTSTEQDSKLLETFGDGDGEVGEVDEADEPVGLHCLICNTDMPTTESEDSVPVFKSQTSTTHRRLAIFLGTLIGQKLTSRKAHSDIMCRRCFSLLDRVDALEVEIQETKDEIVNKYQETVAVHGGRARRRKPATAKKSDYVFPKVEPEDEDDQMLDLENDGTFEPHLEDLMEEEHDRREDLNADDEEWEPEFKRPRIKRENTDPDISAGPPKRKRGRPRKDATKLKDDTKLRVVGKDIGAVDGSTTTTTTTKHRDDPPPPQGQSVRTSCRPYDTNTPDVTTDHQLDSYAKLLKVEDYMCDCGIKSTSQAAHMEHIIAHICSAFKCPQCSCSFTKSSVLAQHQRLVHSPDQPKQRVLDASRPISGTGRGLCSKCGTGVGQDFEAHARTHLYGEFECPICGLRMDAKPTLEMHIERRHSRLFSTFLKNEESSKDCHSKSEEDSGSPVSCDVCGKVVAIPSRLARHRYLLHPEHYPWPCPDCSLAFSSPDSLRHHICPHQQKGDGGRTGVRHKYECDGCGVLLKSRLNLEKHMRSHPGCAGGTHSCPICHRALTSRKALTDHLRHHRRQGFSCKFCGAKLKSMDSLNVHINELHTHVVRLQCKHCPQVFFSSGRLSYHIKRHHTDKRSYTNLCHLCGKVYPYPSELRLHLRSHRDERPYKCDQCQKSFLKQGDLTYHKRSHTGERPHKCPHCPATFPRPNTLTSHIRHHHWQSIADVVSTALPSMLASTPAAMHSGALPPLAPPTATLDPSAQPSTTAPVPTAVVGHSVPPPTAAHNTPTLVPAAALNPPTLVPTVALNHSAPPPTAAINPTAPPPTAAHDPQQVVPTAALNHSAPPHTAAAQDPLAQPTTTTLEPLPIPPSTAVLNPPTTVALDHSAAPPATAAQNPSAPPAVIAISNASVSTPTAPSYMAAPTATVMAISSTPYLTPMNPAGSVQPRASAVTVMSIPGAPRHTQPTTLVPLVEGQLMDSGIEGQQVQYVQVEGLPSHTTLQPFHSQPPQNQYTPNQPPPPPLPYQIVQLQILQ